MPKTDFRPRSWTRRELPTFSPPTTPSVVTTASSRFLQPKKGGACSLSRGHSASKGGRNARIEVAPYSQATILKMPRIAATVS